MKTGRTVEHRGFPPAKPSPPLVCLGEPAPGLVLPNGEGSPARREVIRVRAHSRRCCRSLSFPRPPSLRRVTNHTKQQPQRTNK